MLFTFRKRSAAERGHLPLERRLLRYSELVSDPLRLDERKIVALGKGRRFGITCCDMRRPGLVEFIVRYSTSIFSFSVGALSTSVANRESLCKADFGFAVEDDMLGNREIVRENTAARVK